MRKWSLLTRQRVEDLCSFKGRLIFSGSQSTTGQSIGSLLKRNPGLCLLGGNMRKMMWSLLAVVALGMLASAAGRGASTAEERERFVTITHKLEQAPLQESLHADRDWAYKLLNDVPDIAIDVCTSGLGTFTKQK